MNRRWLGLLLVLSSLVFASDRKEEGEELLAKAAAANNILNLPSFELKANVRIENEGKPIEGTYLLLWNGPDQWREQIDIPGYHEIQVGGKGVVYRKRSLDFIPVPIQHLDTVMSYGRQRLTLRPDETIKQVHHRSIEGVKVDCVELLNPTSHRDICIDSSTGAVVREGFFRDKDYVAVGGRYFPKSLSFVENGRTLVEAQVTDFRAIDTLPPAAFEPPQGAASKPGCQNPDSGYLAKRVNPAYPEGDRRSRIQGVVAIYTLIGADGVPHDLRVLAGPDDGLKQASLDAVRQWRYTPFLCGASPVEIETVLYVSFTLTGNYSEFQHPHSYSPVH
jgi:TonB family protein